MSGPCTDGEQRPEDKTVDDDLDQDVLHRRHKSVFVTLYARRRYWEKRNCIQIRTQLKTHENVLKFMNRSLQLLVFATTIREIHASVCSYTAVYCWTDHHYFLLVAVSHCYSEFEVPYTELKAGYA